MSTVEETTAVLLGSSPHLHLRPGDTMTANAAGASGLVTAPTSRHGGRPNGLDEMVSCPLTYEENLSGHELLAFDMRET